MYTRLIHTYFYHQILYFLLIDQKNIVIQISSHTDNIGKDSYNLELSKRRAKSVVNYLTHKGISADRLKYKGYGETVLKNIKDGLWMIECIQKMRF